MMNRKGMTLVELMVSLIVVLIIIAAASTAYLKLLRGFKTQSKLSESYVEKLSGLELLRYDIEMAGYGLPHHLGGLASYNEAVTSTSVPNPTSFNDAASGIPHAFAHSNNGATGANNSDALVIKSAVADINTASSKWSIIYWDSMTAKMKQWNNSLADFAANDRIIVLGNDTANFKQLQIKNANWWFPFNAGWSTNASTGANLPLPGQTPPKTFLTYSLFPTSGTPRMPFNRVDYYLADLPTYRPQRCADNTFTLYRSTIRHNDGHRDGWQENPPKPSPMFDCVRDFQVAFGLDLDQNGTIENWANNLNLADANGNGTNADELRNRLKEVRLFILYHEGDRDENYSFSGALNLGDQDTFVGMGNAWLSSYTPAGSYINYRWQIAKIVIKPMNLQ